MYTITLTEQEKNVLLQLIDLAVKSGGLSVAEPAVFLSKKISQGVPQVPEVPAES